MKRQPKLKIEISCDVMPDGSLGHIEVSTRAGQRSGYALRDPFDAPVFKMASKLIESSFKKAVPHG